jgi:glutathione peroxidase
MKFLFIFFLSSIGAFFSNEITAFDFTIVTPDGNDQSLSIYEGKPMVVVVLPSIQNDSNAALLYTLNSLHQQFADSLTIIGIPSYEDGYADDSIESEMTWYHSILDSNFVLAQGMNTRKSSPYQSALFRWLTDADQNGHFDLDVMGIGEKFCIRGDGVLHGLVSPDAPYDGDTIEELLNSTE